MERHTTYIVFIEHFWFLQKELYFEERTQHGLGWGEKKGYNLLPMCDFKKEDHHLLLDHWRKLHGHYFYPTEIKKNQLQNCLTVPLSFIISYLSSVSV